MRVLYMCVVHVCCAPCRALSINLDLSLEDIQLWRMNVYIVASASEESSCDLTAIQLLNEKIEKWVTKSSVGYCFGLCSFSSF